MKKLPILLCILSLLILVSCESKKEKTASRGTSDKTAANLKINQTVMNSFSTGDDSMIDSIVSADFVDHTDRGIMGRDSLKAMIRMAKDKSMKAEAIKELADDEYVFSWVRFTGTSDGSMGMPVGPYDMNSMEATRFKDGKAVEHWTFMQPADMMKMMAAMMPAAGGVDSVKATQ